MSDIWRLSAGELATRIRKREISARAAAEVGLARLDAVNPRLNAVIDHKPAEVLADADAIDRRIARGEDVGVLGGVPITVKVNLDQRGFATTNGVTIQRDWIAEHDSPVVTNLRRAGAVILGRTNTPAFSLRWFTSNLIHGDTRNPRDPGMTPGGSSGGAGVALAVGIGHLAHGTDIAGSIRYPAYVNGVHGLRTTLGRVPAFNASSPERAVGPQLMAISGPLGRTIDDLRLGLEAMSHGDARDPWWCPAPLEGPAVAKRAALCLRPNGMAIVPEVEAALLDAAKRMEKAGWTVEPIDDVPSLREATTLQVNLWLGDGFAGFADAVKREGEPASMALMEYFREAAEALPADIVAKTLTRRATLTREWLLFLEKYSVLLLPVSGELPFDDGLDTQGPEMIRRIWEAQLPQTGLPLMGLPGLTVSTGLVGARPVGVQLYAGRFREDLLLSAGEAIEAGGVPPTPIDPVWS